MPISTNLTVIKDFDGTDHWPAGSSISVPLTCTQGGVDKAATLLVVLVNLVSGVVVEVSEFTTGTIAVTKITSACTGLSAYVKEILPDVYGLQNPCCGAAPAGNTTPAPPTVTGDDGADTLIASHALGNSEIVFSTNGGAFVAYTGTINVGNVARSSGYYQFKIKAAAGRNESAVANSPAFTVALTQLATPDPTPSNITPTAFDISWPVIANATVYEWEVCLAPDFTSRVANGTTNDPSHAFNFSSGSPFTIYYVRVRATAPGFTTSAWGSYDLQTLELYDTTLTFVDDTNDSAAGVGGTVAATGSVQEFAFNARSPLTGTPCSMTINIGVGNTEIVVDYPSDYTGQPFRFTDSSGNYRRGLFTNGILTF